MDLLKGTNLKMLLQSKWNTNCKEIVGKLLFVFYSPMHWCVLEAVIVENQKQISQNARINPFLI